MGAAPCSHTRASATANLFNCGLAGFVPGPTQQPIHAPFNKGVLFNDDRVLVVDAECCQIYTP